MNKLLLLAPLILSKICKPHPQMYLKKQHLNLQQKEICQIITSTTR